MLRYCADCRLLILSDGECFHFINEQGRQDVCCESCGKKRKLFTVKDADPPIVKRERKRFLKRILTWR